MKPLSERDENHIIGFRLQPESYEVGMKPLSERDENSQTAVLFENNSLNW